MNKPYYETPRVEMMQVLLERGFASSSWDDPNFDDFDLVKGDDDNEFA